jgi:hypothetical protein
MLIPSDYIQIQIVTLPHACDSRYVFPMVHLYSLMESILILIAMTVISSVKTYYLAAAQHSIRNIYL